MWRLNDLFGNIPAHSAERLSVIALSNLDAIANRARLLLEKNRVLLNEFLDSRDDLETVRPPFGTVVFPRVKSCSVDELCEVLRERYETSVVPGKFFEMADHIRVGIGCETEMLRSALDRLGSALDELR
jgi:aspartate/methionine/tyrosine aminotransferase